MSNDIKSTTIRPPPSVLAQSLPSGGLNAESLKGVLKDLGFPRKHGTVGPYELDPTQAEKLFNHPAVKGNTTSLVQTMTADTGPTIVLEDKSVARLAWQLSSEAPGSADAKAAFEALTESYEKDDPVYFEIERFFEAGNAGKALPEEFKPKYGR